MKWKMIVASVVLFGSFQSASALDKPKGTPILTVKGAVSETNAPGAAIFDVDMLEALQGREAAMKTPWIEGTPKFKGPFLRAVLKAAGGKGSKLMIKALNDYAAEVPIEDADTLDTILALRIDGQLMSVRDKGPLFLIYPFDLNPALNNEKYYNRSVWQIKEIEVIP